jgi:hypothetical protein
MFNSLEYFIFSYKVHLDSNNDVFYVVAGKKAPETKPCIMRCFALIYI